jgi:prepilin-type N-terminal cleavage/methylation domain-containing protein
MISSGFTLAEVLIAMAILGLTAGSTISSLVRMNHNAALSRLRTGAGTIAQSQIDLVLSEMPFNPQKGQIPPSLVLGTRSQGNAWYPSVPIYTDPKADGVNVLGWMTTTVTNTGTTYNGVDLNIYRATVSVSYQYRGRTYTVAIDTLRTSDI